MGLKITRLYNTFDENNKKITDDINKVCKKKSKKTLRKREKSAVTPSIEKFIITNCHAPENEIYFTQKGKESKTGDIRGDIRDFLSTAVNSQVEIDETPTETIRPQKPKKIENTNISLKIESQQVIHNLEEKLEKLHIYSIYVNYDCGFGNALYITGESEYLGSWQKAYKLSVASDCGKLWAFKGFKSIQLKSGIEFKILIYKWVDEDNIVINNIDKNKIFWERPSGAKGNKLTIFTNSEMYHYPLFNR